MSQGENKPKAQKNAKLMLVRYGQMGTLGWFEHHEAHIPRTNPYVVIKTERGLELGQLVGEHCYKGGQFKSNPEQVENYYCNRSKDFPLGEGGQFVRFATTEDVHEQQHLEKNAINEAKCCQRIANELNLEMKIIEAEHLFGGERIIFYFTSEGRVDFRELVKRLAREYQTRIELRQIGSRDEARLISDYESCGQQCCCSRFLKILEPVNMRMAKLQKATLDPSKISGHCGRLKCCLRYEDETYTALKKSLPKRGAQVFTPKGQGKVVDMQILTQLVIVQDELGDRQAWSVDQIAHSAEELKEKIADQEQQAADELATQQGMVEVFEEDTVLSEIEEEAESEQTADQPGQSGGDRSQGQKSNRDKQGDQKQDGSKRPRRGSRRRKNRRRPKTEGAGDNQGGNNKDNKPGNDKNRGNNNDGGKQNGGDQNGGDQNKNRSNNNRRPRRRRNNNRNKQNKNNSSNDKQGGGNSDKPKPSNGNPSVPGGE